MPYTRPYSGGFVDFPSTSTPIDASALNTMDVGIKTSNDQFQTVTTAQRATLTPTVGQAVWDSDLRQLMVYINAAGGNAWQPVGNTIVCSSTTRPSTPFEGQEIYETDTNKTLVYNGSSWVETSDLDSTDALPTSAQTKLTNVYNSVQRLAYGTRTSDYTANQTTVGAAADVFSSDLTWTADGTSSYRIEFFVPQSYTETTVDTFLEVHLVSGAGTDLGILGRIGPSQVSGKRAYWSGHLVTYYTPSVGSASINLRCLCLSSGSGALQAASGGAGAFLPMWLAVFGPPIT